MMDIKDSGITSALQELARGVKSEIELKHHGVKNVFIACVDGLSGFPEGIAAVFRKSKCNFALCIGFAIHYTSSPGKTVKQPPKGSRKFSNPLPLRRLNRNWLPL